MHSLNQWKPKSATGARNGTRRNNQAKALVAFAFSRLFVMLVVMGLAGLFTQGRALAQGPTITLTPNVNSYTEGDVNPITGTVSFNSATPLTNPVTVNIRLTYNAPMAGDVTTSTAVVFMRPVKKYSQEFRH